MAPAAGSSAKAGASPATSIPAAVPGLNKGASATKWSSRMPSTSGSSASQWTPGAALTETKSRPKKTPSTSPVAQSASARGGAWGRSRDENRAEKPAVDQAGGEQFFRQRRGLGRFGIGKVATAGLHD